MIDHHKKVPPNVFAFVKLVALVQSIEQRFPEPGLSRASKMDEIAHELLAAAVLSQQRVGVIDEGFDEDAFLDGFDCAIRVYW